MHTLARTAAVLVLAVGLGACGAGGGETAPAGGDVGMPTIGQAQGRVDAPSVGSPDTPTGGTTNGSTATPAPPVIDVAEPLAAPPAGAPEGPSVDGTLDEAFAVALTSVDVRRRSTGERVPIEVVGVDSGELGIVLSAAD